MQFKAITIIIGLTVTGLVYAHLSPPQVIALIPPDNNLENENLIETLCPKSSPNLQHCREEKLSAKLWNLTVYEKETKDSKILGKIQITGTPGKGLLAKYIPNEKSPVSFPSDSNGTDWGYSSYFEFTVSNLAGDWLQLPSRPFSNPVWINIKKDWPKKGDLDLRPSPRPLDTELVYSTATLGDIVITKFSAKEFSYRKENPNDMLCGEESKKVSPADLKETIKPIDVLFDKDGHLITWPKYSRGC
jgi:hypothetical protein